MYKRKVSAKYSCGFPDPQALPIIVVDRKEDTEKSSNVVMERYPLIFQLPFTDTPAAPSSGPAQTL